MPSTPKGEEAAQLILDSAAACFLSKGYNGTSMRDIAAQAGYKSVAGLYNHYPDKESIFVALLAARQPYDHMVERLEGLQGATIAELLPRVVVMLTDLMQDHSDFFRLVLIDYLEADAAHVRDLVGQMQGRLLMVVGRMTDAPDRPADLMPAVVVRSVASMVIGFTLTNAILPDFLREALSRAEWQQNIGDVLLYGLLKNQTGE